MEAKNRLLIWVYILLAGVQLSAQGWERAYGNTKGDAFQDLIQLADEGYVLVGTNESWSNTKSNVWLVRIDPDGEEEWTQTFGESYRNELGKSVRRNIDGGYIIGGTSIPEDNERGYLVRTDILGNLIWEAFSTQDSVNGEMAIPLMDGNFVLVGSRRKPFISGQTSGDAMDRDGFLMKVDSNGTEVFWKTFGGTEFDEFYAIIELANGDLILGGISYSFGNCSQIYVLRTDALGNIIWEQNYGDAEEDFAYSMILSNDESHLILAGKSGVCGVNYDGDVLTLKIDLTGTELEKTVYEASGTQIAKSIQETTNNSFIITGFSQTDNLSDRDLFLKKIDNIGTTLWTKVYGGYASDGGAAVLSNISGGFTATGYTRSYGSGNRDAYLILTDSEGVSLPSVIMGNLIYTETDCNPDFIDSPVANQIIQLDGPETYYAVTDEDGNFSTHVLDGTYSISVVSLSDYWSFCYPPTPQTVTGSSLGIFDTAMVYMTLKPEIFEPLMKTDIGANHLRPGFPVTYTFSYCNNGTTLAHNATMDITLDEYLQFDTSSVPYLVQNGDIYTFYLGDIDIFDCDEFQIFATLDSTVLLGQTHCVEAHVYPDTLITSGVGWDQSSIELGAKCGVDGDSIYFDIKNVGSGDMLESLEYIIIEDQIMMLQGNFQLNANEFETIAVPTNGGTFRMEAEQSPHHPIESQPSIAVEGCGGEPYSTGQVINFPQNDASPFIDIDCRENTGSFDPNDKQAFPRGWDESYFIEANTDIEYLIRFQNEGTDTAFQVVIRDTLSEWLDPASVIPMVGSHPYKFSVYGQGIVKFTFENILLPHKGIDSLGSMGYVRFRVKQRLDNPLGTEIHNTAAIYFDYNAPVITEPIFHTIGQQLVDVEEADGFSASQAYIKIYPNPFSESTTFEIENVGFGEFTFSVFDLRGQRVRSETIRESRFFFESKDLLSGMYIYKIEKKGRLLHSGKMILK